MNLGCLWEVTGKTIQGAEETAWFLYVLDPGLRARWEVGAVMFLRIELFES